MARSEASACHSVQIDLDGIECMTEEAAAVLLFRRAPWRAYPENISLRSSGRPRRQAVLRAFTRSRARRQPA